MCDHSENIHTHQFKGQISALPEQHMGQETCSVITGDTSSLVRMLDLCLVPLLHNGVPHWCLDVASETLLVVSMVCGIILIWRVIGLLMYCQSGSS